MMLRRGLPLMTLALLSGCGRVGPVRPPGPAERITYPRGYPYQPPVRRPEPPPEPAPQDTAAPSTAPNAVGPAPQAR